VVLNFKVALGKTMGALAAGHMRILDKDYIEWVKVDSPDARRASTGANFAMMAGTGSFLPVEFQPEIMGKFTRNEGYWKTGFPLLDKWESFVIKDYTTAFTALATGQIHLFGRGSWALLPGQVAQAQRDFADKITVHPVLHAFADGIQFYTKPGVFDDRRVRQAINLAIDRDEFLILNEAGTVPGRILMALLFPKSPWSFTEEELRQMPGLRTPKDADIAEANRLMDEVFGAGERPTITCSTTAVADQTQICLFFGDQMKKNLDMTVEFAFAEQVVNTQRNETCSVDITAGSSGGSTRIGDPDDWFFASLHNRTALTPGSVCRLNLLTDAEPVLYPEVLARIDAQSVEIDPVKRKQMVQDLESEVFEELVPKIGFGWNYSFPGAGAKVKGYFQAPLMSYIREVALWERLWLAD
jgi:ABC-type transport system substrate-binding protein